MSGAPDLPPWVAVTVAVLVVFGSTLTLVGGIGLLRLRNFYQRTHAPTLGSTGGVACMALATILCFSALDGGIVLRAAIVLVFVTLTVPVAFILLARAALFRDRVESNPDVPPPLVHMPDGSDSPGTGVL